MGFLEYLFIIIIIYCILRGFSIGFLRQFFSFIAVTGGICIGARSYNIVGDVLPANVFIGGANNIFGFFISFLVIFFIITIIGAILMEPLKGIHLGTIDNKISALLGFFKGAIISLSLIVIFIALSTPGSSFIKKNKYLISLTPHTKKVSFLFTENLLIKFEENNDIYLKYLRGEKEEA
jgi:uncharacterized membrane protein required for colicin V production